MITFSTYLKDERTKGSARARADLLLARGDDNVLGGKILQAALYWLRRGRGSGKSAPGRRVWRLAESDEWLILDRLLRDANGLGRRKEGKRQRAES